MWDRNIELYVKDIGIESQILYLANRDCYLKFHKYGYYFSLPTIIISSVVASLSFNTDFMSNKTNQMVIGSMNILIASLGSIYTALGFKTSETIHFSLADEYLNLYELIRQNLEKPPAERIPYTDFIELIELKRIELFRKNSGIMKPEIIKYYKNKYKKNIELPLVFSHLQPIRIYSDSIPPTPLSPSINVSETDFIVI
jgi:hypothetical protein